VLDHHINRGVGGATKTGMNLAAQMGATILVKVDSDGQMEPSLIPEIIEKLLTSGADIAKGNRFTNAEVISQMPLLRLAGNIGLSFITKLSTGYWELFDPTNGFIALRAELLSEIQFSKLDDRYFFETDLLFRAGIYDKIIVDFPMHAVYGNEVSSLRPMNELIHFSLKHIRLFIKRILYQYYILDFNPGSIFLLFGLINAVLSLSLAIYNLLTGIISAQPTTLGNQVIFLVLFVISLQLLMSFALYDSTQRPILRRLRR